MECPIQVDVLMHRREAGRPTSTGQLVNRVMPTSRRHVRGRETPVRREDVVQPGRDLWILHPAGGLPPERVAPESVQVLLLDGSWREAARMRREVEPWGRLVGLPDGPDASRYRLRKQPAGGRYATAEALVLLLETLGLPVAAEGLRVQFELQVYAGLRSRGAVPEAEAFLAGSRVREKLPEIVAALGERRRCGNAGNNEGAARGVKH